MNKKEFCFKRKRILIWEFATGTQKNWNENKVEWICLCTMKCIVGIHYRIILSLMWISLWLKTVMLAFLAYLLTFCAWISHHSPLFATAKYFFQNRKTLFGLLSYGEFLFLIRIIWFIEQCAVVRGELLFWCNSLNVTDRL